MSRAMKDSGIPWIGEIPKEWGLYQTSTIFHEHKEKNVGLKNINLLSLSYGNIKRKDINTNEGLLPQSFETYNVIKKGDIVFRLTDLQNDKRSLRTGLCLEDGIITSAYVTLRANKDVSHSFYHYLFHTYDVCKVFYGMGDGVRQGMNWDDVRKIVIFSPSLAEQQRIAEFLDRKCGEIDEAIALQEEFIEELKAYKQSVITEAVTRGLNPNVKLKDSGIDWIGKIPQGWRFAKLKLFSRISSGEGIVNEQLTNNSKYEVWGGGNKVMGFTNRYNVDGRKLIIGRVGACGYVKYSIGRRFISDNALILDLTNDCLDYPYLFYVLVAANLSRLNTSTAQPLITSTKVGNVPIPIPTVSEQHQIADYLDNKCAEIDSLIAIKQQKIEELKDYKKSIIYEYVTGKKEVK